jgi:phosphatidylinositol alpha-1,6-mannosyltransferase
VRPERILVVTHEFPPGGGGIGTHCYEMATHWSSGAEVTVTTLASDGPRRSPGMTFALAEVPRSDRPSERLLALARQVRRQVAAGAPDLVYSGHWRATGVAVRLGLAGMRQKPLYAQAVHGSEVLYLLPNRSARLHRSLFRHTTRTARRFVALGSYQGELLAQLGVEPERILVSPEGVDVERFEQVDQAALRTLRERHGLTGRFVLLTVGRLVERKGHDTVIRALPRVAAEVPNIVYLVVGSGPDEARLQALASDLGVEDAVVFCGRVPDEELVSYYYACDAFVMMSREMAGDTEGFGIVFMEAAASGKPTIGGRSGGVTDAIADGETGVLLEPTAVAALADVITRLARDKRFAERLGEAGRQRVRSSYRYADIAATILDGIVAGRP